DARIVHQLRGAGYRIEPLRTLMPELRGGRRWDTVQTALTAREAGIAARSRTLLEASAALLLLLGPTEAGA
ncbi:transcriptional regulator, partial [Streptomyces sp. SID7760]|nr:transcriptional regulator [Streptomyces sp. SID7760]